MDCDIRERFCYGPQPFRERRVTSLCKLVTRHVLELDKIVSKATVEMQDTNRES